MTGRAPLSLSQYANHGASIFWRKYRAVSLPKGMFPRELPALRAQPPPRCADPKGYYGAFLARITAAGDNARSASGFGGVLLALGPLKTVQGIEKKLGAELAQTVGKKS